MADSEKENPLGFVDKRKTKADTGNASGFLPVAASASDVSAYANVAALRTALAAASGTTYTAARLNSMTKNDMIYALRTISDAGGIN